MYIIYSEKKIGLADGETIDTEEKAHYNEKLHNPPDPLKLFIYLNGILDREFDYD